jgi:hypothetical protein
LSERSDTLEGQDRASSEMHFETQIEQNQVCTWRPSLSELGDAYGDHDSVNTEIHLEAVI